MDGVASEMVHAQAHVNAVAAEHAWASAGARIPPQANQRVDYSDVIIMNNSYVCSSSLVNILKEHFSNFIGSSAGLRKM